jgi:hypothetical protein
LSLRKLNRLTATTSTVDNRIYRLISQIRLIRNIYRELTYERVTQYLRNSGFPFHRTGGDKPPINRDKIFLNRSEGYELRDFISEFIINNGLDNSDETIQRLLDLISRYKPHQLVTRKEMENYLLSNL